MLFRINVQHDLLELRIIFCGLVPDWVHHNDIITRRQKKIIIHSGQGKLEITPELPFYKLSLLGHHNDIELRGSELLIITYLTVTLKPISLLD